MRRYDDPVEVRRGEVSGPGHHGEGPAQFLWRGRLWKVSSVLARWVETGPWWLSSDVRAVLGAAGPESEAPSSPPASRGDLLGERELWRVEAGRGEGTQRAGVFDLCFDWDDGRWQLVACLD